MPLSHREIRELQGRDLTPEDYELLLRLDEPIDAQRQKALSQTDLSACVRTGQAVPDGDTTCAICCAEIDPSATASLLPCSHAFHHDCIMAWLRRKPACPMCGDLDLSAHSTVST